MRISYNWLKDYIELKLPVAKLAEILTMAGFPVESITKTTKDCILDIEVTSNRPDCLSFIGIARELRAITGSKLTPPVPSRGLRPRDGTGIQATVSVRVEDKNLCPRYTARVIRNVKVEESPEWLKTKVEAMGLRPVNNIVDITNFCLFETGEPLHAFDLDKISGREVIIRRAKKYEKVVTIDNVERILSEKDLVIADKDKVIAIAGIMGASNTEVTSSTENLLLEAAYFDPVSIRRTSRQLGISTESSYRFERSVDLASVVPSSNRVSSLVSDLAGGEPQDFIDIGEKQEKVASISLRYSRLYKVLGLDIPIPKVNRILNSLGFKIVSYSKEKARLKAPLFRHDIKSEIDCIEEVGRIYGYEKIEETVPDIVERIKRFPFDMVIERKIRDGLTGFGCDEIITYSQLSRKTLTTAGLQDKDIAEVKNPLSSEQEVMRPILMAGLLSSLGWNINRKSKDLKLFELGNVYIKDKSSRFRETKHLSLGMTGEWQPDWGSGARVCTFFDLKGAVETLVLELGIDAVSFEYCKDGLFSLSARASIIVRDEIIGVLGQVNDRILDSFDIKDKVFAAEIDVDSLLKYVKLKKRFKELPKFPSVFRDISIIVDKEVSNAEITSQVKEAAGSILKNVILIDRYIGKQIPDGKIGLTYRLEYQDLTRTLEEKDVSETHAKVLRQLEERLGATLRSTLS